MLPLIMIVMRYFGGFFAMNGFITAAYPFGLCHKTFTCPHTFANNGIFHPLHIFPVLAFVALDHFNFNCHRLLYVIKCFWTTGMDILQYQCVGSQCQYI